MTSPIGSNSPPVLTPTPPVPAAPTNPPPVLTPTPPAPSPSASSSSAASTMINPAISAPRPFTDEDLLGRATPEERRVYEQAFSILNSPLTPELLQQINASIPHEGEDLPGPAIPADMSLCSALDELMRQFRLACTAYTESLQRIRLDELNLTQEEQIRLITGASPPEDTSASVPEAEERVERISRHLHLWIEHEKCVLKQVVLSRRHEQVKRLMQEQSKILKNLLFRLRTRPIEGARNELLTAARTIDRQRSENQNQEAAHSIEALRINETLQVAAWRIIGFYRSENQDLPDLLSSLNNECDSYGALSDPIKKIIQTAFYKEIYEKETARWAEKIAGALRNDFHIPEGRIDIREIDSFAEKLARGNPLDHSVEYIKNTIFRKIKASYREIFEGAVRNLLQLDLPAQRNLCMRAARYTLDILLERRLESLDFELQGVPPANESIRRALIAPISHENQEIPTIVILSGTSLQGMHNVVRDELSRIDLEIARMRNSNASERERLRNLLLRKPALAERLLPLTQKIELLHRMKAMAVQEREEQINLLETHLSNRERLILLIDPQVRRPLVEERQPALPLPPAPPLVAPQARPGHARRPPIMRIPPPMPRGCFLM